MSEPIARLCLRDVRAIDPSRDLDAIVDLVVERGTIVALERGASSQSRFSDFPERDARGLLLLPGLTELHAQMGEPGLEYREDLASGLSAAAAGGYALVASSPDTKPVNDKRSVTEALLSRSTQLDRTTLRPLAAATVGSLGERLAEIGDQLDAGAAAISAGRGYIENASVMRRVLEYCGSFGAVLLQRPQEPTLHQGSAMHEGVVSTRLGLRGSPRAAEEAAFARDISLCRATGARYHARTLSTAQAVVQARRAKEDGLPISCDVTPQHLLLTADAVGDYDVRYRVDPPLREERDKDALLEGLNAGTIDCISCDHEPQSALETHCEFELAAPGMSSLELSLGLIWGLVSDGKLQPGRAVDALCAAPSRVLGLTPAKLEPGQKATFALFDPAQRWTPRPEDLYSKGKNSPFLGKETRGRVLLTANAGKLIYEQGNNQESA